MSHQQPLDTQKSKDQLAHHFSSFVKKLHSQLLPARLLMVQEVASPCQDTGHYCSPFGAWQTCTSPVSQVRIFHRGPTAACLCKLLTHLCEVVNTFSGRLFQRCLVMAHGKEKFGRCGHFQLIGSLGWEKPQLTKLPVVRHWQPQPNAPAFQVCKLGGLLGKNRNLQWT